MAKKKYHHLNKRGSIWYFRKGTTRFSLETTVATEAMRKRDALLENYRIYGSFTFKAEQQNEEVKTFGKLTKEWAKIYKSKVKHTTWRDYRSIMNRHVLPKFKDRIASEITYPEVEAFVSSLKCGNKRKNNILVPMRSIFKWGLKAGKLTENIMEKVDNFKVESSDIEPFTHDEVVVLINSIDPFYRHYLATRFYTGMRDGEINALRWTDYKSTMKPEPKIYINKAFVYNQEGATKTKGSKRYIDCLPFVTQALRAQKSLTGHQEYIFLTKDGDRMSPDHFREVIWKPAIDKAGLTYRPPIQTRHTFATMMISVGEDIGWVKNMLGHSSLQMIFRHYYAWVPRKGRNDGRLFMASIEDETAKEKEAI